MPAHRSKITSIIAFLLREQPAHQKLSLHHGLKGANRGVPSRQPDQFRSWGFYTASMGKIIAPQPCYPFSAPLSSTGVPGTGMDISFRKKRRFFALFYPRSSGGPSS